MLGCQQGSVRVCLHAEFLQNCPVRRHLENALRKVKEMETEHMQPIAELCYDPDGNHCPRSVKDVKDMLGAAAKTLMSLIKCRDEAKALVSKCKSGQPKK